MAGEKLIIIRGPSGSGKSTVAKALKQRSKRPTLLVSEDATRKMFNDHQQAGHDAARLLSTHMVLLGLENGYDVIYEGILNVKTRKEQLEEFLKAHPKENYFFYFDVSYNETLKRHKTRPESSAFGYTEMKRWWDYASPTGYNFETIIPETSSQEQTIATIARVANLSLKK